MKVLTIDPTANKFHYSDIGASDLVAGEGSALSGAAAGKAVL